VSEHQAATPGRSPANSWSCSCRWCSAGVRRLASLLRSLAGAGHRL